METRILDAASAADAKLKNEPFSLYGRMIPTYQNETWSYDIKLFPREEITQMCFPDEDYDLEALGEDYVFIGAYEEDLCVGLAVLKNAWFKYMYLDDLKVAERWRGKGAAAALIKASKAVARDRGYGGIYTIGQDNNVSACKFYLKMGFQIGGFDNRVYTGTSQEGKGDISFYLDL